MAELLFKKGIEESLPVESARTDGTFYVTEDTKKIVLGDAVWEDTNQVKQEIYSEVIKDEKVIAAALTKLNENKQNKLIAGSNIVIENDTISVLSDFKINDNYETNEYPDTDNPDVVFTSVEVGQEFGSAINVLEDNLVLLVNEVIKNEETNALAFTYLNDEKVSFSEFNASLENKLDSEVLSSVISDIDNKITENVDEINKNLSDIDETVAQALTDLNDAVEELSNISESLDNKADKSEIPSLSGYATEEWVESKGYLTADDIETPEITGAVTEEWIAQQNFASEDYVNTQISNLVSGAPETLDTLDELAAALKDNKDIVTVLENAITNKADSSALTEYSVTSHTHDDLYYTESEVDNMLSGKSDVNHIHEQYLTEHQNISHLATKEELNGKQDVITDLEDIRSGVSQNTSDIVLIKEDLGTVDETIANAVTQLNEKISDKADSNHTHEQYLTEANLEGYALETYVDERITNLISGAPETLDTLDELAAALKDNKDIVSVLENAITSKADSSALTEYSVTSHTHDDLYYTESEIDTKLTAKQDVITDLEDIRSGVSQNTSDIVLIKEDIDIIDETISNAVTQLNEKISDKADSNHTHDNYITLSDLNDKGFITDISNLATKEEMGAIATDLSDLSTKVNGLPTKEEVNAKADSSVLSGYSVTSHTHDDKQNVISDLDEIRSGATKGATSVQPNDLSVYAKLTDIPETNNFATKDEVNAKSDSSHTHSEFITLQSNIDKKADSSVLSGYSVTSHTHSQYLTSADIANKQETISDLATIRSGAEKGATSVQPNDLSVYAKISQIPNLDGYAKETYVDNKIAALVSGAPETLDTLDEIAAALNDNKDIVSVLESSIGKKVDTSALTSNYYTESEVNTLLNGKSDSDHTHTQYLTSSDITNKQDTILDLEDIRNGAAKGATALQSIPEEYVTETELNGKGYLTSHQNISHLATKAELSGYTTDSEFTSLSNLVNSKSDSAHTHSEYANKTDLSSVAISGSYNDLLNKPTIPSEVTESTVSGWGFTKTTGTYSKPNGGIPKTDLSSDVQTSLGKADTALQSVPEEYITESELNGKNYATTSQVNSKQDTISDLASIRSNASNGATAFGWGNHADKGYVTSTSLEETLTDYVKVNDVASESDIDGLFS